MSISAASVYLINESICCSWFLCIVCCAWTAKAAPASAFAAVRAGPLLPPLLRDRPPSCCCICMSPHVPQTCVQKRCPSSCSFVTNQIYRCWNNTKAHNAGVDQAEAVVSWICFCGSSVSLEKKTWRHDTVNRKKGETWQRMMTWEDDRRAFSSAPHHSMTADTPAAHKFSIYSMIESYVYCRVFYIQILAAPKIKQTKDPATCSKNEKQVYLQSEVSLLLPKQPALSLQLWESGQDWPGFLVTRLGHCALLMLGSLCCFGTKQKAGRPSYQSLAA